MKLLLYSLFFTGISYGLLPAQSQHLLEANGLIAGKYPVSMAIRINDAGEIYGYYHYEKYKKKIVLSGQLKEDSVILYESMDGSFSFDKGFKGVLKNGEILGQWLDVFEKKSLDFNFNIIDDSVITETSAFQGIFESIHNSDQYFASVILQPVKNDIYFFEISTGTENGCVGFLQGLISLENSRANFYDDNCNLFFALGETTLSIKEEECGYHGYRCSFGGEYKK